MESGSVEMANNNFKKPTGFTIIELMIATSVFSIILLISMAALVYIGGLYYKGVTVSKTQEVTRDVMSTVGDAIRYGREDITSVPAAQVTGPSDWNSYCIGIRKYSFKLNTVLMKDPVAGKAQANQVFTETIDASCGTTVLDPTPADSLDGQPPREILGEFMRVNSFEITALPSGLTQVSISIAYGGEGELSADSEIFNFNVGGVVETCRTGVPGGRFCAVSGLTKSIYGAR